jgi:PIN domain nuclease of toxin-antitoxin system
VILLDTHIWIWWIHQDPKLSASINSFLLSNYQSGIGVSAISCWEVSKLVENHRLILPTPIDNWLFDALAPSGVHVLPLTPEISLESTRLPPPFHKDPADQIIVATSRILGIPLVTEDAKIHAYPHVVTRP